MKIDIILPCYNEEKILEKNTKAVYKFCADNLSDDWQIIIADNNSNDGTPEIGQRLKKKYNEIEYIRINQKGRGRALKSTWSNSNADILCYTDMDLSTNLEALTRLINAIKYGNDIVIGSRILKNSKVKRSICRTIFSRVYNCLLKIFLRIKVKDAQCGFKAINQKVVKNVLPYIQDNNWFFDTEMLAIAQRQRYKITEIPVLWVENRGRKSKVQVIKTVFDYLKSILKLRRRLKNENYKISTKQ